MHLLQAYFTEMRKMSHKNEPTGVHKEEESTESFLAHIKNESFMSHSHVVLRFPHTRQSAPGPNPGANSESQACRNVPVQKGKEGGNNYTT